MPMPLMDPSLEAYSVLQDEEYKTTKGLEDSQKLLQNLGLNQVWEFCFINGDIEYVLFWIVGMYFRSYSLCLWAPDLLNDSTLDEPIPEGRRIFYSCFTLAKNIKKYI